MEMYVELWVMGMRIFGNDGYCGCLLGTCAEVYVAWKHVYITKASVKNKFLFNKEFIGICGTHSIKNV